MNSHDKKGCCGGGPKKVEPAPGEGAGAPARTAIDPICKMTVQVDKAPATLTFDGQTYYFCHPGCRDKFAASKQATPPSPSSPTTSLPVLVQPGGKSCCGGGNKGHGQPAPVKPAASQAGTYTCPMHPEVVKQGPGDCPDCGMPLEPLVPTAKVDTSEIDEAARRLRFSAAFTIPLAILSMSHMLGMGSMTGPMEHGLSALVSCWLQLALATPVVFWAARPFFARAKQSVLNRSLNMFSLLAMGIGIPYLDSVVSLVLVTLTGGPSSGQHMVYFESAAVITTLAWLGQYLEAKARTRSTSAVREFLELVPDRANVILPDGTEYELPVAQLVVGTQIRLRPGQKVPADGRVVSGSSSVDESMLTGEPVPAPKSAGSKLTAGTINQNGSLVMQAERVGEDTVLAEIVRMVSEAQRSRMPVQRLVDRLAALFVPLVVAIAFAAFGGWLMSGGGMERALTAATSVLVIACPCALGLATPMSIIVATGRAARAGVLFKEARALQLLQDVDTIVLDKTGTLTEGKPALVRIETLGTVPEKELLALAASVEALSEHPLSAAVVALSDERGLGRQPCSGFASEPGQGVSAKVMGRSVRIGTEPFALTGDQEGAEPLPVLSADGDTSVLVAIDGKPAGRLYFQDTLRDSAVSAIAALKEQGLRLVVATGDAKSAAQAVGKKLGLTEVHARMTPAAKLALVQSLQSEGARVAMVGDGVNDAAALAEAYVGVALSTGTDIAMSTADMVLLSGDLAGLVRARVISRAMMANVKQNLFLAFAYNIVAVPLAAGVLHTMSGYLLDPMAAALAMSLSSVAVICNALRLRNLRV